MNSFKFNILVYLATGRCLCYGDFKVPKKFNVRDFKATTLISLMANILKTTLLFFL